MVSLLFDVVIALLWCNHHHRRLFISGNTAHSQEKTRKADRNRQNTKTRSKTQKNI